jgi:hypothetical protein
MPSSPDWTDRVIGAGVAQWIAFQQDMLRTVTLRLVTSWVNIFRASLSWNSDTTQRARLVNQTGSGNATMPKK